MTSQRRSTVVFFCIAAFCAVLMAWWVYFMAREAGRLEELGKLIPEHKLAEAARILGVPENTDIATEAARRRWMFASESIVLGALVILGVVILYRGMLRERRTREQQERFLTGATHHLKTPLATVKLGIESRLARGIVAEPEAREDSAQYLDHHRESVALVTLGTP